MVMGLTGIYLNEDNTSKFSFYSNYKYDDFATKIVFWFAYVKINPTNAILNQIFE